MSEECVAGLNTAEKKNGVSVASERRSERPGSLLKPQLSETSNAPLVKEDELCSSTSGDGDA